MVRWYASRTRSNMRASCAFTGRCATRANTGSTSMMLVPTYVAASAIHGLGLFAAQPIAAGTVVWRFAPGLDQIIAPERVGELPAHAREFLERYAFESAFFPGGLLLSFDDTRFINHDDDPNIDNSGIESVARRDIASGEELTCDYRELDGDAAFVGGG